MPTKIQTEQTKAYWSKGGQIFFCDGKAYGIDPSLRTICIGDEDKIIDALQNNKLTGNKTIDNILAMEINNRGKQEMVARTHSRRPQVKIYRH